MEKIEIEFNTARDLYEGLARIAKDPDTSHLMDLVISGSDGETLTGFRISKRDKSEVIDFEVFGWASQ